MIPLWRRAAGVAVLALLAVIAIPLLPPYVRNFRFQRSLDDLMARPQTPELLQAAVVNRAGEMGLPVRTGDVKVTREGNGLRVDIVYVVRVDFPMYTVDLHFHPASSTD
jgi:hypothetical protein